jgi:hypothetical protein
MKKIACLLLVFALRAQEPVKDVSIEAGSVWTDTGIDLRPGDTVRITISGTLKFADGESGPAGLRRGFRDLLRSLPLNQSGRGAAIARIGSSEAAAPFLVGERLEFKSPRGGRLFVGANRQSNDSVQGSYTAKIEFVARGAEPAKDAAPVKVPAISQTLLDGIPRRVQDADGTPGDTVNFLIVGPEDRVREALKAAGWVQVDRSNKDAVLAGLMATLSKQAYLTLPMSELRLYGRPQDYGYAHAEPVAVVARRHHFRIWKAPVEIEGQQLWVGAGTHDIGFDRDQRNNKVTHKIDADIDKERDFIGESLNETGLVSKLAYVTPSQPVTKARTAHGAEYFSDGRTLVVYLTASAPATLATSFANLFCSVLKSENPDGGTWGDCKQFIEAPSEKETKLDEIAKNYRVLIIPGILSSCVKDTPAFDDGQKHLREKHGLTVDFFQVPNDPSESNAKKIAEYLKEKMQGDARKYIAIGYSKGGPDLHTAVQNEPDAASAIAAFVSVAGAIGGSPIADQIPAQADQWIRKYSLPGCEGDLAAGFKSLKRSDRQAFLTKNPKPAVPSYSLPAVSTLQTTSKSLMQSWQLLNSFASLHDGQVTRDDAVIPGSKYLGYLRGDHFAVALAFEKNQQMRSFSDKNHYPRAALLEAVIRYVAGDLAQ